MPVSKERIIRAAEYLSKSQTRLAVFSAIYKGKKSIKTVLDLEGSLQFEKKKILGAGKSLADNKLVVQGKSKVNNKVTTHYEKLSDIASRKPEIIRLAENKPRLRKELDGLKGSAIATTSVTVRMPRQAKPVSAAQRLKILYLAAAPTSEERLRVDREYAELQNLIDTPLFKDRIQLYSRHAVTPQEILNAFNRIKPDIIHFSGHGDDDGILVDDGTLDGFDGVDIDYDILAKMIKSLEVKPQILILNSCRSAAQIDQFLQVCPLVIAMNKSIKDATGIKFTTTFYAALSNAVNVQNAVMQAETQIAIYVPEDVDAINFSFADDADPNLKLL